MTSSDFYNHVRMGRDACLGDKIMNLIHEAFLRKPHRGDEFIPTSPQLQWELVANGPDHPHTFRDPVKPTQPH